MEKYNKLGIACSRAWWEGSKKASALRTAFESGIGVFDTFPNESVVGNALKDEIAASSSRDKMFFVAKLGALRGTASDSRKLSFVRFSHSRVVKVSGTSLW